MREEATASSLIYSKNVSQSSRRARREKILIINRRDMRVAIYSSRFARVAAAYGGKAQSEVRSPKIKGIPSIG